MNRRGFIKRSAIASASLMLPRFLNFTDAAIKTEGKTLVVVQLSGGNDALNTVIPFVDDNYFRLRPKLNIPVAEMLKITQEAAFNPALQGFRELYDSGELAVISNVGYPNPDRSHFRSMDIWQTAAPDSYLTTGWIGRYLDASCPDCTPYTAIEADDTLSLALKGEVVNGLAVKNPERLYRNMSEGYYGDIAHSHKNGEHQQADYLYKTLTETVQSAEYLYRTSRINKSIFTYPSGEFANNLKTIADLINSGCSTRIYYVSLSGFDTHIQQISRQGQVLGTLSNGLNAFVTDLKRRNTFKDVLVMTFSEFGRRAQQNASGGTDHGKAGNMFIIGADLKQKGFINPLPDLSKLDEGDLIYNVDFRNVYATVLNKWLQSDAETILGKKFDLMNFI